MAQHLCHLLVSLLPVCRHPTAAAAAACRSVWPRTPCISQKTLSRIEFLQALQEEEYWADQEGGVDKALDNGKDILRLAQAGSPEVVLLTEG